MSLTIKNLVIKPSRIINTSPRPINYITLHSNFITVSVIQCLINTGAVFTGVYCADAGGVCVAGTTICTYFKAQISQITNIHLFIAYRNIFVIYISSRIIYSYIVNFAILTASIRSREFNSSFDKDAVINSCINYICTLWKR